MEKQNKKKNKKKNQPRNDPESAFCQPVKPTLIFRRNHPAPLWTATLIKNKNKEKRKEIKSH